MHEDDDCVHDWRLAGHRLLSSATGEKANTFYCTKCRAWVLDEIPTTAELIGDAPCDAST